MGNGLTILLPLTVGEVVDKEEGHRYGWMAFFSEFVQKVDSG
jgi:hypothetical protein